MVNIIAIQLEHKRSRIAGLETRTTKGRALKRGLLIVARCAKSRGNGRGVAIFGESLQFGAGGLAKVIRVEIAVVEAHSHRGEFRPLRGIRLVMLTLTWIAWAAGATSAVASAIARMLKRVM